MCTNHNKTLQQTAALAAHWQAGNAELGLATACTIDHSVRAVKPLSLQRHLEEHSAAGNVHHAALRTDESKSFWILDLPLPVQVDGRRYRCHTCAHMRIFQNFPVQLQDVLAAYPDVLVHEVEKQAPVLMTRRFLLHLVQLFYDRLNARATRRALVEQVCGNALSLNVAGRIQEFCSAVPKSVSIRSIIMAALEDYTKVACREMQRLINVYSGSVIRGDGNHDVAKRITVYDDSGQATHPFTVLLAWVTVDGALFQPVTLSATEDWPDLQPDLDAVVSRLKEDRLAAGLSLAESAPIAHATDSYRKQRLLLDTFYKNKYHEMGVEAISQTAKGDAQGAKGGGSSCTIVCGDPLHDQLALQRRVSAASPDASCLIADHKDIMQRLSLKPLDFKEEWGQPAELAQDHDTLLRTLVEELKETALKQLREDPAGSVALKDFLEQPMVNEANTWLRVFGASPTRGVVRRACEVVGAEIHESMGYHGFAKLADFKKAIKDLRKWYEAGKKSSRRRRGIRRVAKAKPRVQGKRSAITATVADHYSRLLQPLRLEGFWKWRQVALAVQEADVPLQTGTVAVERWWSSLKQMLPSEARCLSKGWFDILARLAFLRHNIRHFQAGSTAPWADGDPLLSQRVQFFEDCARLLQQTGDMPGHPIFQKFLPTPIQGNEL